MNEVYTTSDLNSISVSDPISTEIKIHQMKMAQRKQNLNDRIMLTMILLVGLFGFIYVFFLQDNIVPPTQLLADDEIPNIAATKLPTQETKKLDTENQLTINGNREANEKIQFVLDSFNEEVVYTLRFGNGNGRVLKEKITDYVYPKSGVFQVTLEARYKTEEIIMFNEYLSIDDAITVAEGAFQEQI